MVDVKLRFLWKLCPYPALEYHLIGVNLHFWQTQTHILRSAVLLP